MPSLVFYFQVHQPYRMRHYPIFDIGEGHPDYFDDAANRAICEKVADKCYRPANALMLELIRRYPGRFKIAYSISGVALEQFAEYTPDVLESFRELFATGQVELLTETYYHSLAALFNADEFRAQIRAHQETTERLFGIRPTVFRNTELIYSNGIADMVEDLGFKAMLTEGADRILGWRTPNFVYEPQHGRGMKLLLKNYRLSDDIAFRFSQQSWKEWPLTPEKYARWIHETAGNGDVVNLFMDYETFGEHQWADTGIFEFMRELPEAIWRHPDFEFKTPSEAIATYPARDRVDIPHSISWADEERDLSAWLGNPMQDNSIAWVYKLEKRVKEAADDTLLHLWRKLQTSDHFYYMCTKYWADGDVHKYFSAYDSPHDSYVIMSNVLTDLEIRLKKLEQERTASSPLPRPAHSIASVSRRKPARIVPIETTESTRHKKSPPKGKTTTPRTTKNA